MITSFNKTSAKRGLTKDLECAIVSFVARRKQQLQRQPSVAKSSFENTKSGLDKVLYLMINYA